jgi:hypothetical protein
MVPALLLALLYAVALISYFVTDSMRTARKERAEEEAMDHFGRMAGELGLEDIERDEDELRGTLDGVEVRFEKTWRRDVGMSAWTTVGGYGNAPVSLVLVKAGAWPGDSPPPKEDRRTGDPAFDEAITLLGERKDIALTVTPAVRELALEVVGERGCQVRSSYVEWEGPLVGLDEAALVARVPGMVRLARLLREADGETKQLARIVTEETCPPMAGFVAEQLFTLHPVGKPSARVAKALRDHPSGRARLFAALRLAPEGSGWLRMIAEDVIDERVFRKALSWAADHVDDGLLGDAATEALELNDSELRRLACGLLAERGELEAIGPLHRLAATRRVPHEVRKAAQDAATAIHTRCGADAVEGGLALSVDDSRDGALELVDDARDGGLELADPE